MNLCQRGTAAPFFAQLLRAAVLVLAAQTLMLAQAPPGSTDAGARALEEAVVSLDGTWLFRPDGRDARELPVPSFWDRQRDMREVHRATYSRSFDIPREWRGQRLALRFDAVGDAAEVFVNGQHVGGHAGAALPFEVDLSGVVEVPSSNRLEVIVRDDSFFSVPRAAKDWRNRKSWIPRGMGANNRKGLYQSVSLRARPPVWIEDARIQTSVRQREVSVGYQIFNSRPETLRVRMEGEIIPNSGGDAVLTLSSKEVEVPGYVRTTVSVGAAFGTNVVLWQPDHPALYRLRSTILGTNGPLARQEVRFGFREVWFAGIHFYLNGIRCNLRGESPSYGEKIDLFATREAAEQMVRRYQAVHFNVLRFHALPPPPHVLDVCDELGMLVIDESAIYASWQMLMPEHPRWLDFCREHLTRWVRRDRNHPSIVLWSAENEGLNVNLLTPAMLAEFGRVIEQEDGTRPVIFAGDGSAHGVSPASNKHYVKVIDDLRHQGGRSSGYARDLRTDIYWATEFAQDRPLGCGEFLFPYEPGLRDQERDVCYMMGLQTRGYRLAQWCDIRPYNPSYTGFLRKEGVRPGYEEAFDIIVKSFAPVAVFDKEYDALGPYPAPPTLTAGQPVRRTLIVYNDTFSDEQVLLAWDVTLAGRPIAGEQHLLVIPLGHHTLVEIAFTPDATGDLRLNLRSSKGGREQFQDQRRFLVGKAAMD